MLTLVSFRSLATRAKITHHIKATMRATLVAILAVAAVTSCLASAAAAAEGEGIVHVLTNDNFNAATAEGDWLVKFYAVRWLTLASWGWCVCLTHLRTAVVRPLQAHRAHL